MNKVIVISAIVDTQCLTLYTDKGDSHVIMQGDPRVPLIVGQLRGVLTGPGTSMEIDLDEQRPDYTPEPATVQDSQLKDFNEFEKQSGFGRFFKVAKSTLRRIFMGEEEEVKPKIVQVKHVAPIELNGMEIYNMSDAMDAVESDSLSQKDPEPAEDENYALPADTPKGSIDEVMANARAIPASSPDFAMTKEEEKTHDIVAAVDLGDGSIGIVPNAHKLATQVAHATATGNKKGVEALLKRLAAMPAKRQHSVEDLLKFLERGDLPITDDGRIVFYKLLNKAGGQFGYADCHTGKVNQGANVEVRMAESLVDHNRNNECSNGLHVARRQYLSGFGGTDCFLGSLAPEDVIAVPTYDANKMRVCAYQLHFHLTTDDYRKVKSNTMFDADSEAAKQLALILAGKQAPVTHRVVIGGQHGTNITVHELLSEAVEEVSTENVAPVAPIAEVDPLQAEAPKAKPVELNADKIDPTQLAGAALDTPVHVAVVGGGSSAIDQAAESKKAEKLAAASKPAAKTAAAPAAGTPRARIAELLTKPLTTTTALEVYKIKKAAKKGWDKLGVDAGTEKTILALLPQDK